MLRFGLLRYYTLQKSVVYPIGATGHMIITIMVMCILFIAGCRDNPVVDIPVTLDLVNARFENDADGWHFAFDDANGKIQPREGITGSKCVVITLGPNNQFDCFSQAVIPMKASSLEVSAYVRVSGLAKAYLSLECDDPAQFDNPENYGQLGDADSQPCPSDGKWHLLTTEVQIPKRTQNIRVWGCVRGSEGVAFFDDFNVVRR